MTEFIVAAGGLAIVTLLWIFIILLVGGLIAAVLS